MADVKKYAGESAIAQIARNVKHDILEAATVSYKTNPSAEYTPVEATYRSEAYVYGTAISQPDAEGGFGYLYVNQNGNARPFFRGFMDDATGEAFTVRFAGYNLGTTNGLYINGVRNDETEGYQTVFLPIVDSEGTQLTTLNPNAVYTITVDPAQGYTDNARKAVVTKIELPGQDAEGTFNSLSSDFTIEDGQLKSTFDPATIDTSAVEVWENSWDVVANKKVNYVTEDGKAYVMVDGSLEEITGLKREEIHDGSVVIATKGLSASEITPEDVEDTDGVYIGDKLSSISGSGNVMIGSGAGVNGEELTRGHIVAIGDSAKVGGNWGIGIGFEATGSQNSVAIGNDASTQQSGTTGFDAKAAVALGAGTEARADNSVALGAGAVATEEFTVSVGKAGQLRRIVNVADATADTDAVTLGQMNQAISTIPKFAPIVVEELPTSDIRTDAIYFVRNTKESGDDLYTEYIYIASDESGAAGTWEELGSQPILTPEEEITAAEVNAIWAAASDES